MEHLILNLIILWIGVGLYFGNKKLEKHFREPIDEYSEYLYKLHRITGKSEYELFEIAAVEAGLDRTVVDNHFGQYLKKGDIPLYVKDFIDRGKPHIDEIKITNWS